MTRQISSHEASARESSPTPSRLALVSLVFPIYNEKDAIPLLKSALADWIPRQRFACEIVLVDDGSSDGSLDLLRDWAHENPAVRALSFSRNFGHQVAVVAALHHTSGQAVVIMDADLQDPLEVIPEMVRLYEHGYDIVYGRRQERLGETLSKKATAWLFYRLMRVMMHRNLPPDTGDFRLVSERCVRVLRDMPEGHLFLRGLFAWMGFKQTGVTYVRQPRAAGETKYNYRKMVSFAANAALSFSPFPIRAISLLGTIVAGGGFLYGLYSAIRWYTVGDTVAGWPTIVILITVIGGMNLVCLGVIGEYISRIYEETKKRPLYLVKERINLTS